MTIQTGKYKQIVVPPPLMHGLVTGALFIFLLGGIYTGYLFYGVVKSTVKEIANRTNLSTSSYIDLSLPLGVLPLTGDGSTPVLLPAKRGATGGATGVTGVPLPDYQQKERVNILLLGVDKRYDDLYARTDTMMLITVDPNAKTAAMLSIPRDLWVTIPGYNEDRINKAYFLGDKNGYPGGGPALAMKTVQQNLGVPVHFYAQIDFEGFIKIIDTLGGIDIYVPETIDDPKFPNSDYGYDPFYIEAGEHSLDGYDTMRYARTRATAGSDFSRAKRQQQVMLAIKKKALQLNMVTKIPRLWNTMSGTFETNLQLVDILELAQLADKISMDNIETAVIDQSMTIDYVVPDTGAMVLLPIRKKIKALVKKIFTKPEPVKREGPTQAEIEAATLAQAQARAKEIEQQAQRQQEIKTFLAQEKAKLVVQNGTNISDLASKTSQYLKQQGFDITQFGPADSTIYSHTVIVVYDKSKNYTLQVLSLLFDIKEENIRYSPNPNGEVDFRVIIGSDFKIPSGSSFLIVE